MDIWYKIKDNWFSREEMIGWVPPVIMGIVLRCWSLWFGLPNRFRPDEDMVVLPALGMMGGDLDPHDYTYPTLYKYLLVLVFRICMALGQGAEGYTSAWQYAAYGFFVDSTFFFQAARVVTVILGLATILAVYRIGCDAYSRWVGSVSAWLLAVSVLHVRDSHFGVTDVPSVAFLILALVYIVRIAQQGGLCNYVWAGLLVGLAASTKYGSVLGLVPLGVAHLLQKPEHVPLLSRWIWNRSLWISGGICVLAFVLTSPYIVWNAEGFVRDFGFQMRHVYEYGHAADLGPGWLYHPKVTLHYGVGLLVLLCTVGGLVLACLQRRKADWVLLSLFVAFFVVTGRGRTVFFRYVLPLVPLCCVFASVALDRLRQFSQGQYANGVGIALVALCAIQPLWASIQLDILLGREDTRALAREWIEKEIPEGQIIANVGGLYGDVNIRNRHAISWWLPRFYWACPDVPESDLVAYLSKFEDDLPPFFIYNHFIGNRDLDSRAHGWLEILDNEDIAVVITHEHPLPYSQVNPEFMAALKKRAYVWAAFEPGEGVRDAVFDLQDAFYYPMARFGQMERGGPIVKIWRIRGRDGLALEKPGEQKRLLRDTFFWLGNGEFVRDNFDEALAYYGQAIRTDVEFPDVRIFVAAIYLHQNKYQEAAEEIRKALAQGQEIGQLERVLFYERSMDAETYARLGAVCGMVGYYKEAAMVYERAVNMGYHTPEAYNNLGVIYHAQKNYERAVWAFERALELDGDHVDARRNFDLAVRKLRNK